MTTTQIIITTTLRLLILAAAAGFATWAALHFLEITRPMSFLVSFLIGLITAFVLSDWALRYMR